MDNLPAHKADGMRQATETAGGTLLSTSRPTAPDFNPIENFSQLKALLRKGRALCRVGNIVSLVGPQEFVNDFAVAGYEPD